MTKALVEEGLSAARKYVDGGWRFVFEPETRFIGVYHPQGGKQSICELSYWPAPQSRDALGYFIADILNRADHIEAISSENEKLRKALEETLSRVDYARGYLHNSSEWDNECFTASDQTIWEWINEPSALLRSSTEEDR